MTVSRREERLKIGSKSWTTTSPRTKTCLTLRMHEFAVVPSLVGGLVI